MVPVRPIARVFALAGAAVLAATLSGCAATVSMTAAAAANDPGCAAVIVRLPDSVAGLSKDETNAQSTAAWGNPVAVQLRCGVTPLGPTTQPCVAVVVNGTEYDWVLESDPLAANLSYITFGRTPATEVTIAHAAGGVSDSDVLNALSGAIGAVPQSQTAKCLGATDAP